MIQSFGSADTKRLFQQGFARRFSGIERSTLRKLEIIDSAKELGDVAAIPGNRMEALKGSRKGQYSIRINDQWRICFVWKEGDAHDVEIVDYH